MKYQFFISCFLLTLFYAIFASNSCPYVDALDALFHYAGAKPSRKPSLGFWCIHTNPHMVGALLRTLWGIQGTTTVGAEEVGLPHARVLNEFLWNSLRNASFFLSVFQQSLSRHNLAPLNGSGSPSGAWLTVLCSNPGTSSGATQQHRPVPHRLADPRRPCGVFVYSVCSACLVPVRGLGQTHRPHCWLFACFKLVISLLNLLHQIKFLQLVKFQNRALVEDTDFQAAPWWCDSLAQRQNPVMCVFGK